MSQEANTAAQLQDKLLRLGAEFENYKKRVQREREELIKYAGESFILELLHIIDDFERAFSAADKTQDFKILHQGVEMILREVQEFLKTKGVKKMEVMDKEFDPHKHEAIEHVVREDKPENIIVEELQAGYELNGRVIRPARVKVNTRNNGRAVRNGESNRY
jgi:molecular chaperone GrpE